MRPLLQVNLKFSLMSTRPAKGTQFQTISGHGDDEHYGARAPRGGRGRDYVKHCAVAAAGRSAATRVTVPIAEVLKGRVQAPHPLDLALLPALVRLERRSLVYRLGSGAHGRQHFYPIRVLRAPHQYPAGFVRRGHHSVPNQFDKDRPRQDQPA